MYNRILKRPMFKMGGRSYSAQGTGITSGLDTPKRGLVDGPGGYAGDDTREIINTEREEIFRTPEGQNFNDIVASFGEYSNTYNEDGDAKTIGQMGYDQAKNITTLRKDRADQQKLASLEGLESREAKIIADEKFEADKEITKLGIRELEIDAQRKYFNEADALYATALQEAGGDPSQIPPATMRKIEDLKTIASKGKYFTYADAVTAAQAAYPMTSQMIDEYGDVEGVEAQRRKHVDILTGNLWAKPAEAKAEGGIMGRTKLAESFPGTAGDAEAMQITENDGTDASIDLQYGQGASENAMNESAGTMGMNESPEETYKMLRAKLPQEITDDVVQLISFNVKAFEDFAAILDAESVLDFNRKYGVELVLPAAEV